MPSISTNLAESQKEDLIALCRLGAQRLNEAASKIEQRKITLKRSEFRKTILEAFGASQAAEAAIRALPGLAIAIRGVNISTNRLFEMIGSSIQGLSEQDLRLWHECRPIIQRMVSSPFIVIYSKSRDLAFDFERLYARSRILTDIRPVFDDHRNEISGFNIVQTLRMDYFSSDGDQINISIALDMKDIDQLKVACEDALKKANVVRNLIEKNTQYEAALPGEDSDQ